MGWAAIVTALLIAALLIDVFECVPVADFWRMMGGYLGGHCIKVKVYFIAIGSISAVINFVLLSMVGNYETRLMTSLTNKANTPSLET